MNWLSFSLSLIVGVFIIPMIILQVVKQIPWYGCWHKFDSWETIEVQGYRNTQERTCTKCNYLERRMI